MLRHSRTSLTNLLSRGPASRNCESLGSDNANSTASILPGDLDKMSNLWIADELIVAKTTLRKTTVNVLRISSITDTTARMHCDCYR